MRTPEVNIRSAVRQVQRLAFSRVALVGLLGVLFGGLAVVALPPLMGTETLVGRAWVGDGVRSFGAGVASRIAEAEKSVDVATAEYFHDRQGCSWLYGGVIFKSGPRRIESSLALTRESTWRDDVSAAVFVGAVRATEGGSVARAAAMWASSEDEYVLRGRPVRIEGNGAELVANKVAYRDGELSMPDGAWVRLDEARLPAGGGAPVHVESPRAAADRVAGWWRFEGGARAWSGSDLLTADVLEVGNQGRVLAEGSVRLSVRDRAQVEVSADSLDWWNDEGRAVFHGSVEVTGMGRNMRCESLEVVLDEGSVVGLECIGDDVHVEDEATGNLVTEASRFQWDAEGFVEIDGCPARVVRGENGDRMEASVVRYDLVTGALDVG